MPDHFLRRYRLYEEAELLAELGSEDRLGILTELAKNPLKLSKIAESMSSTIQEVSRQCGRLERAGLIEKHSDASYSLSSIGKITISLLPSFALLHSEKDYFRSHDASSLPTKFMERIGDLLGHKRVDHIDDALKFQERVVRESERFVWFMSDQPVGHSLRESHSHFSKETTLRLILPKRVDLDTFRGARAGMGPRFEIGVIDDVSVIIAMNEKIAALALPTMDGRSDYTRGLFGDSPAFHEWCRDLFSHFWEKAEKIYRWE